MPRIILKEKTAHLVSCTSFTIDVDQYKNASTTNKTFFTEHLSLATLRSNHPEVFLGKGLLKICSKFTGEHPCRIAISIKLLCNVSEIALRHGCSPVNLLHIFRTPFPRNTSEWLLLYFGPLNIAKFLRTA